MQFSANQHSSQCQSMVTTHPCHLQESVTGPHDYASSATLPLPPSQLFLCTLSRLPLAFINTSFFTNSAVKTMNQVLRQCFKRACREEHLFHFSCDSEKFMCLNKVFVYILFCFVVNKWQRFIQKNWQNLPWYSDKAVEWTIDSASLSLSHVMKCHRFNFPT